MGLNPQTAVGPQLPLAAEPVRGLHQRDQAGGSSRADAGNLAQQFRGFMFPALGQKLGSQVSSQGLQAIQLLGRRNVGGVAVRSAAAAGAAGSGVQSAAQCLIKGGQQERQGGCAPICVGLTALLFHHAQISLAAVAERSPAQRSGAEVAPSIPPSQSGRSFIMH